jgi:hypothetical protein
MGSIAGVIGGFTAFPLFRAFLPRFSLGLARCFLGVARATVRFAGPFRADLEGLRALRRAIAFAFVLLVLLPLSHNRRLVR